MLLGEDEMPTTTTTPGLYTTIHYNKRNINRMIFDTIDEITTTPIGAWKCNFF